tara:strand:+ start:2571 stop:3026 length:456 start_codon:yes stop_codon:yes gene_type:complete
MLSELKFLDFIFIFLFGFVVAAIVAGFTTFTSTGQSGLVGEFIEIYALVLLFLLPIYVLLKSKSYKNFSYLAQEKLYIVFFIAIVVLVGSLVTMNIYKDRKKPGGFITFIVLICVVLVGILIYAANSSMNTRYGLNMPNLEIQQLQYRMMR